MGHDKNDFGDDIDMVNFSKNFKIANEKYTKFKFNETKILNIIKN